MQYCVLGPLEVWDGQRAIPLGGPKQRLVLANLLIRADHVVPADRLIEDVWGDEPPETGLNALQTYVSRLRRALQTGCLEGRSRGYVLRVRPDEVDSVRFEALLREARDLLRDDPSAAGSKLEEAVALWRGPPFADLAAEPSLRAEIARLENLRLSADEHRIAAELSLGRHTTVVRRLEVLTDEHPLRERLWADLMVALYRSSRQGDAIAAYHKAKTVLAEELGIDPSPELQDLYQRILTQDPALRRPTEAALIAKPDLGNEVDPGTLFAGYRIASVVARGGMSTVYLAEHLGLRRKVALKLIAPHLAEDARFRERFVRESQTAASLDHPNVIPIYEAGDVEGRLFIAMRFVDGKDLRILLRDHGRLEAETALSIVRQIAGALDAAHARGLVHRDVKPGNVLISSQRGTMEIDHVYLSDFGLTKRASSDSGTTGEGQFAGTLDYAAPEQFQGQPLDARTDVYSLGCVLYECLVGHPPFRGETDAMLMYAHLTEAPPRVTDERPDLPGWIDDVVATALAKDREDRYESAGTLASEVARAVESPMGQLPTDRHARRRTRRPRRRAARHRLVMLAALSLVVVAAAVIVPRALVGGLSSVETNSVGVIDPETAQILRSIALPYAPGSMAVGRDAVWVTAPDDGRIMRIDQRTETVVDSTVVGSTPAGIAFGFGAVWVVDSAGPAVIRVSPDTNETVSTISVGNGPIDVAIASGAVWVTNRLDGTVSRIDPETNEETDRIPVGDAPSGIAGDTHGVWVANSESGTLVRIDGDTNELDRPVNVGNQPGPVAIASDGVWVGNTLDATVSLIDPVTSSVTRTVPVGLHPSEIAVLGDSVWVANEFGGSVSRVTATENPVMTIRTGSAPRGAAAVGQVLWVTVRGTVTSHLGGTLRVVMSEFGSIDPAFYDAWWLLPYTNDGLVGYKRVGGVDGLTVVPDLAVSLPVPTDGGTTYRFQLRKGLRYSTGAPVRASDFRWALERGFRIEGSVIREERVPISLPLVGEGECRQAPESCDLSEGVETDDAAGTVTFHLTEPDPDFLYKLALPMAYAVPAGTPPTETGTSPVPATGPYLIDEYVEGERLVLTRNPEFRAWHAPAQPGGYPDRIEVRLGLDPSEQVTEVERGLADWMADDWYLDQPETTEHLFTRYAGQVHQHPGFETFYLMLNTSMPPFDDLRARKAVSYAVDRAKIVELSGGVNRVTCQLLPPNLTGYEPYCPYTRNPNVAGQWSAPDLERARKLIEISGTAGEKVVLWDPGFGASGGYLARLLDQLGYRVTLRQPPWDPPRFEAAVIDSPDRVHAALLEWGHDFPLPSNFFDGSAPRCPSAGGDAYSARPFGGTYCDRRLEAAIARAKHAQLVDPHRAGELWARADRRLVAQSPYVMLTNGSRLIFLSERVGNYQYNPQLGVLLDQLWVR